MDDMAQPHADRNSVIIPSGADALPQAIGNLLEIDLAGSLRRAHETLHSIDVCHDAVEPARQGIFRDAVHLEIGRRSNRPGPREMPQKETLSNLDGSPLSTTEAIEWPESVKENTT
jgi:hypothetical protein